MKNVLIGIAAGIAICAVLRKKDEDVKFKYRYNMSPILSNIA